LKFLPNKIRKLTESDIEDVIELYADTCKNVEYYQKLFNKFDCKDEIKLSFKPDVTAAIRTGLCLGMFEKNKLIGCLLAIDWFQYKEKEYALFKHMFDVTRDYTKQLIDYAQQFDKVYFIFAVGIMNGRRCQGNATALIKHFDILVPKDVTVITDCIYSLSNSMWLSQGYMQIQIGDNSDDLVMVKIK